MKPKNKTITIRAGCGVVPYLEFGGKVLISFFDEPTLAIRGKNGKWVDVEL